MPCEEARGVAERAHRGQVEPSGAPYIDHVRRVAASVPAEAASVAWLHDVLEWTGLTDDDPALAGLAPHERRALLLLTRHGGDDDDRFLSHLRDISVAPGAAGEIARAVKGADMEDRMRLPRDPNAAWRPPYRRALTILAGGHPDPAKGTTARYGATVRSSLMGCAGAPDRLHPPIPAGPPTSPRLREGDKETAE